MAKKVKQRSSLAFRRICLSRFLLWFECASAYKNVYFFGMFHHLCACVHTFVCTFFFCWNLAVPWMYVDVVVVGVCGGGVGVAVAVFVLLLFHISMHTTTAQKANTHLNIKTSYWCNRTKEEKIAVQQVAVSSFHTISINFSLSLALYKYHCFLSVFPCSVGRYIFGTLVRTDGPHAFMTCIMMKRKPTQLKRFSISANNIAFSCPTIFMWAFIVCSALNVRLPFALSRFGVDSWS